VTWDSQVALRELENRAGPSSGPPSGECAWFPAGVRNKLREQAYQLVRVFGGQLVALGAALSSVGT